MDTVSYIMSGLMLYSWKIGDFNYYWTVNVYAQLVKFNGGLAKLV